MFKKIKGIGQGLYQGQAFLQYCQIHDSLKWPVRQLQNCISCAKKVCYLCLPKHQTSRCTLKLAQCLTTNKPTNNSMNQLLNQGKVIAFNFAKTKCLCGQILYGSYNSVICAACANATCSQQCHYKYIALQGKCSFYQNFSNKVSRKIPTSLPSISIKGLHQSIHKNHPFYTKFNSTSDQMLSAYTCQQSPRGTILLQRGYRQYGNPCNNTIQGCNIIKNDELDFHLFNRKSCKCRCKQCLKREIHSIVNCEQDCQDEFWVKFRQKHNEKILQKICRCQCTICMGAKICHQHQMKQCFPLCKKNV